MTYIPAYPAILSTVQDQVMETMMEKILTGIFIALIVFLFKELYKFYDDWRILKKKQDQAFIDLIIELAYSKESIERLISEESIEKIKEIGRSEHPKCVVCVVLDKDKYKNIITNRATLNHEQMVLLSKIIEKTELFYRYYELLGTDTFGNLPRLRQEATADVFKSIGEKLLDFIDELYRNEKFREMSIKSKIDDSFEKLTRAKSIPNYEQ